MEPAWRQGTLTFPLSTGRGEVGGRGRCCVHYSLLFLDPVMDSAQLLSITEKDGGAPRSRNYWLPLQ